MISTLSDEKGDDEADERSEHLQASATENKAVQFEFTHIPTSAVKMVRIQFSNSEKKKVS